MLFEMEQGLRLEFTINSEGVLKFRSRLCEPNKHLVKEEILSEAHGFRFVIQLSSSRMYKGLRK